MRARGGEISILPYVNTLKAHPWIPAKTWLMRFSQIWEIGFDNCRKNNVYSC